MSTTATSTEAREFTDAERAELTGYGFRILRTRAATRGFYLRAQGEGFLVQESGSMGQFNRRSVATIAEAAAWLGL